MSNIFRSNNSNIHDLIQNRSTDKKEEKKDNIPKKKINTPQKLTFKKRKENTICSLKEVEHFLRNGHKILNYINLYKILK